MGRLGALTAQKTRLLQAVPAARPPDDAYDFPAVSVEIELLALFHLLGRLELMRSAVGILEREKRGHIRSSTFRKQS